MNTIEFSERKFIMRVKKTAEEIQQGKSYIQAFLENEKREASCTIDPNNDYWTREQALVEVKALSLFMDNVQSLNHEDPEVVLGFLNNAFAQYMDTKAKAGLLFREEVGAEIKMFNSIMDVVRGSFQYKEPLNHAYNHYENLRYILEEIISEENEAVERNPKTLPTKY